MTPTTTAETNFLAAYHDAFHELFGVSDEELLTLYKEDIYGGYPTTPAGSAYDSEMKALYCMIRLSKPLKILEIGNWRGHSSNHILLAVEKNGVGEVHLVDIKENIEYSNLHSGDFVRHLSDSVMFLNGCAEGRPHHPSLDFDFIIQDGCHEWPHVQKELQILKKMNSKDFHVWAHDYFAPVSPAVNVKPAWDAEGPEFYTLFTCVNREEVRLLQEADHKVDVCGVVLGYWKKKTL